MGTTIDAPHNRRAQAPARPGGMASKVAVASAVYNWRCKWQAASGKKPARDSVRPMRRSPLDPPNRRIRLKLAELCPTVADLDAFCLDAFGKVHRQFAPGMTRSQREDLLLASADPDDLAAALGPSSPHAPRT